MLKLGFDLKTLKIFKIAPLGFMYLQIWLRAFTISYIRFELGLMVLIITLKVDVS